MDEILNQEKLVLFVLFVMPGFIALKIYELLVPQKVGASSERLIDAVAYSCVNYGLWIFPILKVESLELGKVHPNWYAAFYLAVVFLSPAAMALSWVAVRQLEFAKRFIHNATSRPWDHVFSRHQPYWVQITLKGGRVVGGKYDTESFASGPPADESIYLEEAWEINDEGGFERPYNDTAGIIVLYSEMVTIELFKLNRGPENAEGLGSEQAHRCLPEGVPTDQGPIPEGEGGIPANQGSGS